MPKQKRQTATQRIAQLEQENAELRARLSSRWWAVGFICLGVFYGAVNTITNRVLEAMGVGKVHFINTGFIYGGAELGVPALLILIGALIIRKDILQGLPPKGAGQ